jgi:hypothetical protein
MSLPFLSVPSQLFICCYLAVMLFMSMFALLNKIYTTNSSVELLTIKYAHLWYRCCKFDLHGPDAEFWDDFDSQMVDCIRYTIDRRVQFYEEE